MAWLLLVKKKPRLAWQSPVFRENEWSLEQLVPRPAVTLTGVCNGCSVKVRGIQSTLCWSFHLQSRMDEVRPNEFSVGVYLHPWWGGQNLASLYFRGNKRSLASCLKPWVAAWLFFLTSFFASYLNLCYE